MRFLKENLKNNNKGEFSDYYEFTLSMIFVIFLKIAIPTMAVFVENFYKSEGEFEKVPEFTPVITFVIFPQK